MQTFSPITMHFSTTDDTKGAFYEYHGIYVMSREK